MIQCKLRKRISRFLFLVLGTGCLNWGPFCLYLVPENPEITKRKVKTLFDIAPELSPSVFSFDLLSPNSPLPFLSPLLPLVLYFRIFILEKVALFVPLNTFSSSFTSLLNLLNMQLELQEHGKPQKILEEEHSLLSHHHGCISWQLSIYLKREGSRKRLCI